MASEYAGKQQKYLYPSIKTYYADPLVLVEGNGRRVKDVTGKEYLDCFGGILTTSVGHARPEVVEARRRPGRQGRAVRERAPRGPSAHHNRG